MKELKSPWKFLRLYWGACAKCGATISDGERYCDYCRPRRNRG